MKKSEYVSSLRKLADFIELSDFPDSWKSAWGSDEAWPEPCVSLFVYDKKTFGDFCRNIGSFEKSSSGSYLTTTRKLENARITVNAYRERVCEKVHVGTKTIQATEERIIPAEPEHDEEIYEWKCPDSFLSLQESK